jgi:hypothetical protein
VYIFDCKSRNKHRCVLAIAGKTVFAQYTKARSIHRGISYRKMKDGDQKKFTPPLGTDSKFFHGAFANLCTM